MAAYFNPTHPLLRPDDEDELEQRPTTPPRTRRATIAAVSILLCSVGATVVISTNNGTWVSNEELASSSSSSSGLSLDVTNSYGALASKQLYGWSHMAEPHKESTLTATAGTTDDADDLVYTWTITHAEATTGATVTDYTTSGEGLSSLAYTFTLPATSYSVTATAAPSSGSQEGVASLSLSEDVMVKYVRREIRQLSDDDRETYLAATSLFHRVGLAEGVKAYGAKWTNYEASTAKHLARMTLDGCTPYHGYDTFLPAHEAFILEFEQALQSVDPSISAPYWDYTIDTVKYGHVQDIAASSPLFTAGWFGPIDNSATGDVLVSTHFSHVPVPRDRASPEHNGFGFLTDSLNQNPSAFVTRSSSICGLPTKSSLAGCTELKSIFNVRSLTALRTQIETVYHATLHMSLGGATDCAVSLEDAAADESMGTGKAALFEAIGMMANTLWRTFELSKVMRCATDCALTTSSLSDTTSCSCSCPSVDAWADDEKYDLAYAELDHAGVTQMLLSESATSAFFTTAKDTGDVQLAGSTSDENKAFWKWFVDFACHPGRLAQYATPLASNNDPIFWVSHAAWGRYWHFIRLAPTFSEDFHNDWLDVTVKAPYNNFMNQSNCESMLKLDDLLPFKNFVTSSSSSSSGDDGAATTTDTFYSNRDLLDLFSPTNPDLPYVYDNFDWDHCDEDVTASWK
jgi:hypothetical protein